MNYLDIIILVILIIFAYSGLKEGLIREAFSLAAFIVGIYGAMYFSDFTTATLGNFINVSESTLGIIAFIITFIVLSILINIIGKLISKLIETLQLGFIDKIGGFIFGAAKGALLISVFILVLNFFDINIIKEKTKNNSLLYQKTETIANYLYDNHDIVKATLDKGFEKTEEVIEEAFEKGKDIVND